MANVGDVLYVKSGGPPMTVVELNTDGKNGTIALCWMVGTSLSRCDLPESCLVSEDPGPAMQKARADVMAQLFPAAEEKASP